jgi:outer membrane autotransporter protein
MKKIAIASLIALAATAASALEIGTTVTRDYSGSTDRNGGGVTVGQTFGANTVTAGFERQTVGRNDQDRFSLTVGREVVRIKNASVAVKGGVAHLNNQTGQDGYAMTVGAGVSVPLTKQVSFGLDVARQYGQERVQAFDGTRVTAGLNYRF